MVLSLIEQELSEDYYLRKMQRFLFDNKQVFKEDRFIFNQGRSLGILNADLEKIESVMELFNNFGRLLINIDIQKRSAIQSHLKRYDWEVDVDLNLLTTDEGKFFTGWKRRIDNEVLKKRKIRLLRLNLYTEKKIINEVHRIYCESKITSLPGWFLRAMDVNAVTLVALNPSNEVIAVGSALLVDEAVSKHCMLLGICVDKSWRNQGVGEMLNLHLGFQSHRIFGWSRLDAIVERNNEPAQKLYEKMGLTLNTREIYLFVERKPITKSCL